MDTKKLRQKILDLAIRGKLVPQDPNDEPASVLLERIRAEKERLIKEGKIKRSKKSASDTPHYENDVPSNWAVCRLEDIAVIGTGATPDTRIDAYYNGNIPWINSSSTKGEYIEIPSSYISEKAISETNCQIYPSGSLIMAMYGEGKTRGQVSELRFDSATNQACAAIVPIDNQMKGFLKAYLKSNYYHIRTLAEGGNQPNLNLSKISQYIIPIPPIDEQVRIIAAIEKWFALIETLETAKEDLQTSIVQAKSKILDLAIHGKLVAQDPNDEPAIELLKRINPKFAPCDNAHYENMPDSWCVVPLGNICCLNEGQPITNKEYPYIDVKGLRTGNYASKQSGKYVPAGTTLILVDGENSGEVFHTPVEGYQGSTMKVLEIDNEMNAQYVLYFVKLYQKALRENKVGSAIPHLDKKMFRELIIPIPTKEEQERIVGAILQYYRILDNISAEL